MKSVLAIHRNERGDIEFLCSSLSLFAPAFVFSADTGDRQVLCDDKGGAAEVPPDEGTALVCMHTSIIHPILGG